MTIAAHVNAFNAV